MPPEATAKDSKKKSEKAEKNMYQVFVISAISMAHQAVVISYNMYTLFVGPSFVFLFINNNCIGLKHAINFFVFYFFNNNFKKSVNQIFKIF